MKGLHSVRLLLSTRPATSRRISNFFFLFLIKRTHLKRNKQKGKGAAVEMSHSASDIKNIPHTYLYTCSGTFFTLPHFLFHIWSACLHSYYWDLFMAPEIRAPPSISLPPAHTHTHTEPMFCSCLQRIKEQFKSSLTEKMTNISQTYKLFLIISSFLSHFIFWTSGWTQQGNCPGQLETRKWPSCQQRLRGV